MEDKGLHNLKPAAGATKARKRVGRGPASGTGKTAGRGTKGQKARSGSHNMPAGFEGGQMPIYMRISKLRGSTKKMSMPMGPFRTHTVPVNVGELGVFDAGTQVTPELLKQAGIINHLRHPVKVLGTGELSVKLELNVHAISRSARAKVEAAGGSVTLIAGPRPHGREAARLERAAQRSGGANATEPVEAAGASDAADATDA